MRCSSVSLVFTATGRWRLRGGRKDGKENTLLKGLRVLFFCVVSVGLMADPDLGSGLPFPYNSCLNEKQLQGYL